MVVSGRAKYEFLKSGYNEMKASRGYDLMDGYLPMSESD